MNDIQLFENPAFGSIRTLEIDGTPYWVAADVTRILGYKRSNDAVKQHCQNGTKHPVFTTNTAKHRVEGSTNTKERTTKSTAYVIPESDLYRLIVHSKLPSAKAFEKWVYEEVLPELRKKGSYGAPQTTPTPQENAEIAALREELREIRNILEQQKTPPPALLPAPRILPKCDVLYKTAINAMLDLLEKKRGETRSSILHRHYQTFARNGQNIDMVKARYMEKNNLTQCSAIDAICGFDVTARNLIWLLSDEIVKTIDADLDARI